MTEQPRRIEVDISLLAVIEVANSILVEGVILKKLRNAGIPLKGILKFRGVTGGTLSESMSCDGTRLIYAWREP